MDPIEEFEFKPLTKGLGFHKKSEELKKQMLEGAKSQSAKMAQDIPLNVPEALLSENGVIKEPRTQQEAYADLLKALESPISKTDDSVLNISPTLPRESDVNKSIFTSLGGTLDMPDFPMPKMPPLSDLPDIIETKKTPSFKENKSELKSKTMSRGASNSPKVKLLELAAVSIPAGILDGIFVVALSALIYVFISAANPEKASSDSNKNIDEELQPEGNTDEQNLGIQSSNQILSEDLELGINFSKDFYEIGEIVEGEFLRLQQM